MLDKIIENKIVEVKTLKADQKYSLSSLSEVEVDKRFFYDSLKLKIKSGKNAIIAELKKHSPSKGELNENLNIAEFCKHWFLYAPLQPDTQPPILSDQNCWIMIDTKMLTIKMK